MNSPSAAGTAGYSRRKLSGRPPFLYFQRIFSPSELRLVGSAQAVGHYEIARYGTIIAWAEELGHDEIVRLLNTNLNEEKAANTKLNTVAVR